MSEQNGTEPDVVTIPRELLQQIVDYLGSCPAVQVYPMLRRLELVLGDREQEPTGGG